jgi:hypothetical protein
MRVIGTDCGEQVAKLHDIMGVGVGAVIPCLRRLVDTGGGLPFSWNWNPHASSDDLSAHDNANSHSAERHEEVSRHASSTCCNTITPSVITAVVATDDVNTLISTPTSVEQKRVTVIFQRSKQ